MAIIENSGLYQYIDENGNIFILYPVTKLENVTGADKLVHSADGKTLSTLDGTKVVLADLEELDKVANAASRVEYVDNALKTLGGTEIAMGNAKIATGSYVGTGTYGEENPCTLSFDFAPKFMVIKGVHQNIQLFETFPIVSWAEEYIRHAYSNLSESSYYCYGKISNEGKTVHWYCTNTAHNQVNTNGVIFHYIAIG